MRHDFNALSALSTAAQGLGGGLGNQHGGAAGSMHDSDGGCTYLFEWTDLFEWIVK